MFTSYVEAVFYKFTQTQTLKPVKTLNLIFLPFILTLFTNSNDSQKKMPEFYEKLANYCQTLPDEFEQIPEERKEKLIELGDYILTKKQDQQPVQITVICTHNSRRSHMGQLWLQTAAAYYEVDQVSTFSGGTEGTAFNPRAVAALERAGFQIEKTTEQKGENNPVYKGSFGKNLGEHIMFSKKYSHPANPQKDFCAVMVCSEADEACPIVFGADGRISIPYVDPKAFDNTDQEAAKYDERCRQIAREMFWVMDYVRKK